MYPFLRLAYHTYKASKLKDITILDTHECTLRIHPQDIDIFNELNNGRILTLFDLGRLPFGYRVGLMNAMKRRGWGLTMARLWVVTKDLPIWCKPCGKVTKPRQISFTALQLRIKTASFQPKNLRMNWVFQTGIPKCPNGCKTGYRPKTPAIGRLSNRISLRKATGCCSIH